MANDEEVGRVAARDEAARVEHQRFVGAGVDGLDQRLDQVQPAVRVEAQVEDVGAAGAKGRGEEREAARLRFGLGRLPLGDDDDRRLADDEARVLVRRALDAARHHQPDVHAIGHRVPRQRVEQGSGQLGTGEADVERDRGRAFVQAVEVRVEADEAALHQAQPLPDAVAEDEAAVEDRDPRLVARHEVAVDVDQDAIVARVGNVALGAFALGQGRGGGCGHEGLAVDEVEEESEVRSRTRGGGRRRPACAARSGA